MKRIYFYDTGSFMKNWWEWVLFILITPGYLFIADLTAGWFQAVYLSIYTIFILGYAVYKYKKIHSGYSIKYGGDDFELKLGKDTLNSSFSWIERIKVSDEVLTIERKFGKESQFDIQGVSSRDIDKLIKLLATKNSKKLEKRYEAKTA